MSLTTNEHILRDLLAHRTHLIRAENGVVSNLLAVLDSAFRFFYHAFTHEFSPIRVRTRRKFIKLTEAVGKKYESREAAALADQVTTKLEVVLKASLSQIEQAVRQAIVDTSLAEMDVLADILNARTPVEILDVTRTLVKREISDEDFAAITSSPVLKRQIEAKYDQFLTKTQNILQDGFETGQSASGMAGEIRGAYDTHLRKGIAQIARGEIGRSAMDTMATVSANNLDLVTSEQWLSAFDSKVCIICMSLDGQVFDVGDGPYPITDSHENCRCIRIPVLASFEDLGIDMEELPAPARASMNGAVPGGLTYQEFFVDQDEEFQREVLGKTRFDMWSSGQIDLKDMTIGTRIRSIQDLVKLNKRRLSRG